MSARRNSSSDISSSFFLFLFFSSRFQAAVISFIHDMHCLLFCLASNIHTLWNVLHVTGDYQYHTTRKRSVNILHAVWYIYIQS